MRAPIFKPQRGPRTHANSAQLYVAAASRVRKASSPLRPRRGRRLTWVLLGLGCLARNTDLLLRNGCPHSGLWLPLTLEPDLNSGSRERPVHLGKKRAECTGAKLRRFCSHVICSGLVYWFFFLLCSWEDFFNCHNYILNTFSPLNYF